MAKYTPDRGDILHLQFDPSSGQEMKGPHFGLVVSSKEFNVNGLTMFCPISQGAASSLQTIALLFHLKLARNGVACPNKNGLQNDRSKESRT